MITCERSTDFSIEVSEFTQGRNYGLEALQSQSSAVPSFKSTVRSFRSTMFTDFVMMPMSMNKDQQAGIRKMKIKSNPVFDKSVSENIIALLVRLSKLLENLKANVRLLGLIFKSSYIYSVKSYR